MSASATASMAHRPCWSGRLGPLLAAAGSRCRQRQRSCRQLLHFYCPSRPSTLLSTQPLATAGHPAAVASARTSEQKSAGQDTLRKLVGMELGQ